MSLIHRIDVAAGRKPADVKLVGGRIASVFSGTTIATDVAIADGVIVGFGDYNAKRTIDISGGILSAGLIDSHLHIESTLLTPCEFARAVIPHGTTSVIADPHEIANVLGADGIRWMLDASEGLPLDIYLGLPSCVPATGLETSGARLGVRKLKGFVNHPRVVAVGEVMNYPGVIQGKRDLLEKVHLKPGMRVDGHAPGLTGKDLNAYIVAGIHSDHESTRAAEAKEKLIAGMHLMIREGTTEKNLGDLAKVITPINAHRCFFCSDDRSPSDLVRYGHIDDILRRAVKAGIAPMIALQMATNNAPYYFRLKERKGAVAIGYRADLVVFDDLRRFKARMVFKDGALVARDGTMVAPCKPKRKPRISQTVRIKPFTSRSLRIPARSARLRVIELMPDQIVTRARIMRTAIHDNHAVADPARDLLKLVVVERHRATGRIGIGFVKGFGLKRGALASSVAHDSHNIIAVGTDDDHIHAAVRAIEKQRGGFVVVADNMVLASLALPVAGLMTDRPAHAVADDYDCLRKAARKLGVRVHDPFLQLSFLALPVIPALKLTDRGLVDAHMLRFTPLFV